jgi:hypothetical protein
LGLGQGKISCQEERVAQEATTHIMVFRHERDGDGENE